MGWPWALTKQKIFMTQVGTSGASGMTAVFLILSRRLGIPTKKEAFQRLYAGRIRHHFRLC